MIFENTLENIKLFCPEMAPVIDDRNLTIDVMSLLPPRIELLVSKNSVEALRVTTLRLYINVIPTSLAHLLLFY